MSNPTRDMAVREPDPPLAPTADGLALFERLARDPDASVEKIERLMALWERGEARKAEAAFNVAMTDAQQEMRPVAADATNPQTRSKYASYKALDDALRPIYTKHGFALSFNTGDAALPEYVRVLCKVRHRGGHAEPHYIDMPADGKGARGGDVMTKTHATGSAVSYGMRYLLKMVFNVAVGEHDDDGNRAAGQPVPDPPSGFEDWLDDLMAVAENGWNELMAVWRDSKQEYRDYADRWCVAKKEAIKTKAREVEKAKARRK